MPFNTVRGDICTKYEVFSGEGLRSPGAVSSGDFFVPKNGAPEFQRICLPTSNGTVLHSVDVEKGAPISDNDVPGWEEARGAFFDAIRKDSPEVENAFKELVRASIRRRGLEKLREEIDVARHEEYEARKQRPATLGSFSASSAFGPLYYHSSGTTIDGPDFYFNKALKAREEVMRLEALQLDASRRVESDVYAEIERAIGPSAAFSSDLHLAMAAVFLGAGDPLAARRQFEEASVGAQSMAERQRYMLRSLELAGPAELELRRGEVERIYRVQIPALAEMTKKVNVSEVELRRAISSAENFVEAAEVADPLDIERMKEQFAVDHSRDVELLRNIIPLPATSKPPYSGSIDMPDALASESVFEGALMFVDPEFLSSHGGVPPDDVDYDDLGVDLASNLGGDLLSHSSGAISIANVLSGFAAEGVVTVVEDMEPPIENKLGPKFDDDLLKRAGYTREDLLSREPLHPGLPDEIRQMRFAAWQILHAIDVMSKPADLLAAGRPVQRRRRMEEEFQRIVEERLKESGGNIPLGEGIRYAGSMGEILVSATSPGGDIEAALKEGGDAAAAQRFAIYARYAASVRKALEPHLGGEEKEAVREVLAGLELKLKFDGNIARHRYTSAIGDGIEDVYKRYGNTDMLAAMLSRIKERHPQLFDGNCLIGPKDHSQTEQGRVARDRESAFFEASKPGGMWASIGAGMLAAAGYCAVGAILGGGGGTFFGPGVGTVAGAMGGCRAGATLAASIAAMGYESLQQSRNIEANVVHLNDAARGGFSGVGADDARYYKRMSRLDVAMAGVVAAPGGGMGRGLGKIVGEVGRTVVKKVARGGFLRGSLSAGQCPKPWTIKRIFREIGRSPSGGVLNGDFWSRFWRKNVVQSIWKDDVLSERGKRWVAGAAESWGPWAGRVVAFPYRTSEALQWIPGLGYSVYDYVRNDGQLSFFGGVAAAMPLNQLGRIVLGLRTSGAAVYLGFTIGLEAVQQFQGGSEYKAPDGWKILTELLYSAPQRAAYNMIVQGSERYRNALIEPILNPMRMYLVHQGKWGGKIFRSIENPRNEGIMWTWGKLPNRKSYRQHTITGRTVQLAAVSAVLMPSSLAQSYSQDADFENLLLQVVARYGYGAYWIIPKIKAPRGMDTASAELHGRGADAGIRLIMNETNNKYLPTVLGFRAALSHSSGAEQSDETAGAGIVRPLDPFSGLVRLSRGGKMLNGETWHASENADDYVIRKARRSMGSVEPMLGLGRVFGGAPVFAASTWRRPHKKALVGFHRHLSEVLLGGPVGKRGYDNKYRQLYSVYSEKGDPTVGEFGVSFINFIDRVLGRDLDYGPDPFMREFIAVSACVLADFIKIRPENAMQAALIERARNVYLRRENQIREISARAIMEHSDIKEFLH